MKNIFNKIIKFIKTKFYYLVSGKFKKQKQADVDSETKGNAWVKWLKRKLNKNKIYTNNPQLTKLMETKMTFNELKEKEFKLTEKRQNLVARRSAVRYSEMLFHKDVDYGDIDILNNEIYQIDDLLTGVKTKIREVGFEYELVVEKALPKSTGTIITENKYPEKLSIDDLIELMILSETIENETLKRVRLINKE